MRGIVLAGALVAIAFAGGLALTPVYAKQDKVTVCHAAGREGTTHFVTLEVPANDGGFPQGHFTEGGTQSAGHEEDYLGPCLPSATASPTPEPSATASAAPSASPTPSEPPATPPATPQATPVASPTPSPSSPPQPTPQPETTPQPSPQLTPLPSPATTESLPPRSMPETDTESDQREGEDTTDAILIILVAAMLGALMGLITSPRTRYR